MMPKPAVLTVLLTAAAALVVTAVVARTCYVHGANRASDLSVEWSPRKAASYLDQREVWWQQWPRAQKDHGTVCISCHTNVPYALVRPGLQRQLDERAAPAVEARLLASVETRVHGWSQMVPFYSDAVSGAGKTAQSHSTEAVLNAILLASNDQGEPSLRPVTRAALGNAWALELPTGGWLWQDFHLGPWESVESSYQAAALLLLEVESSTGGYAGDPGVRDHVALLRVYLQQQYTAQPFMNQLYMLWASAKTPGLLTPGQHDSLVKQLQVLQQVDGGWRLCALDKTERLDDSPEPTVSDGMATALAVLALEESGTPPADPTLRRGLAWLEHHQEPAGNWSSSSLNKDRDPASNAGLFMSDAATAYAVLALQRAAVLAAR